jgi:hypothetical protein
MQQQPSSLEVINLAENDIQGETGGFHLAALMYRAPFLKRNQRFAYCLGVMKA